MRRRNEFSRKKHIDYVCKSGERVYNEKKKKKKRLDKASFQSGRNSLFFHLERHLRTWEVYEALPLSPPRRGAGITHLGNIASRVQASMVLSRTAAAMHSVSVFAHSGLQLFGIFLQVLTDKADTDDRDGRSSTVGAPCIVFSLSCCSGWCSVTEFGGGTG